MSYVSPQPDDLSAFLNVQVDDARANYFIGLAEKRCRIYVSPLPEGAEAVVTELAAQGYVQPTPVSQETVGPYSVTPTPGRSGVTPSRAQIKELKLLAGTGGAFSISGIPAGYVPGLPWWDES